MARSGFRALRAPFVSQLREKKEPTRGGRRSGKEPLSAVFVTVPTLPGGPLRHRGEKRLSSLVYADWALGASLIPHREHRWK